MTRALVTGANGFIGAHLVRELLARGYEVSCLVRPTSDLTALRGLPVTLCIGDVRESETLIEPLRGVDYVFHLAALLMVTSRAAFEQTNTLGTRNLIEAAERQAPALKRFLFVSSQAAAGPSEDTRALDETAPPNPVSWYGTSKKLAEEAVRASRLPATIVRPASVYGEQEKDISQIYPLVERRIQPRLGILSKYAVMVYVGDLVRGIVDAAESDNALGQTYFLNHPEALTTQAIVTTTARALGKPWGLPLPVPIVLIRLAAPFAELVYELSGARPPMTRDKAREIGQRYWVADPSKARRDFGWEAQHDFARGMQNVAGQYQEENQRLRAMPGEDGFMLWLKYVICASVLGVLIEITSAIGQFYTFQPWWAVFLVIFGAFGAALGSIALWLRKHGDLVQFAAGTIGAGTVELLNELQLLPYVKWTFAPGWPFGITDPWLHSLVLGCAGGIFVLVVNALMRLLYQQRLRMGVQPVASEPAPPQQQAVPGRRIAR